MRDISLHILDIAENSIRAGAGLIKIGIMIDTANDTLVIEIDDNGCGMDSEMLKKVKSPFVTTRTERNVGLGIPLLLAGCENAGGNLKISSEPGAGTSICAMYRYSHIDRPPMGDVAETILTLTLMNPQIDFIFSAQREDIFLFDTRDIKASLDGLPVTNPDVSIFLREYLKEGTEKVLGGIES